MVEGTETRTTDNAATDGAALPGVGAAEKGNTLRRQTGAEPSSPSYCSRRHAPYRAGMAARRGTAPPFLPRMHTAAPPDHGFYVDLHKTDDGNLRITLTRSGRREFGTILAERDAHGIHTALCTLLEDHLGNGWEMVPPEDIGGLAPAPIPLGRHLAG